MMSVKLSDIGILNIKSADYCCIISGIRKKRGHKLNAKYWFDRKDRNIIKHKNILSHIKMGKKNLTFGYIETEKKKFYHHKGPIFVKDLDIGKVLLSKKISSGEKNYKYFIGYFYNDHKFKPLHIILPKISAYIKHYDG